MAPAFAPVLAGAALLALAGIGKVRRPAATVGALKSVGFSVGRRTVRALGVAEVVLGITAIAPGGPLPAALLGLAYLTFTGFVILALRSGGALSSCGCLGRPDTPPTRLHAVVTTLIGIGALIAAGFGGISAQDLAWSGAGATLLAFSALVTWLAWVVFAVLPHARLPRLQGR
jgi:hypothetical protein